MSLSIDLLRGSGGLSTSKLDPFNPVGPSSCNVICGYPSDHRYTASPVVLDSLHIKNLNPPGPTPNRSLLTASTPDHRPQPPTPSSAVCRCTILRNCKPLAFAFIPSVPRPPASAQG